MSFYSIVYEQVKKIPSGKVATYGQIATLCGCPRGARAVGSALHMNPDPLTIPCHRVLNRMGFLSGRFAFGGINSQKVLLEKEGITVSDDYLVDLSKFGVKL